MNQLPAINENFSLLSVKGLQTKRKKYIHGNRRPRDTGTKGAYVDWVH